MAADGSWWEQITPGPNSGRWNQPCPCGVVQGLVRDAAGNPLAGRPVFLEGKDMVYTGADGRFRYEDVPTGTRWLVAYRGGGQDVFDAQPISVAAGATLDTILTPDNWCGAQEVFWSPDESRLAAKACYVLNYQWYTYLVIFDAATGAILGNASFPANYTMFNVGLHGWSPDGRWLLFSMWITDTSNGVLAKVPVAADGSLNVAGTVNLLTNTHISGATWGRLNSQTTTSRKTYIPLIMK